MSSRAVRRLNRDVEVIKINEELGKEEDEDEELDESILVGQACKKKGPPVNPFSLLGEEGAADDEEEEEEEEKQDEVSASTAQPNKRTKRRRRRRRGKAEKESTEETPSKDARDEVDAAVREVNKLLGEMPAGVGNSRESTPAPHHSLLRVDRRFLNADNEMKRIFGSKVVRGDQIRKKAHRKIHHRPTILAAPKDTWPKIDKLGLSMQLGEVNNGCQHFYLEHSPAYQKIQFSFLDAVETFEPNTIAAILQAHPYHLDSLLQMSEVSKMGEDIQTASELIERALYCLESSCHTFFNFTQGTCRLSYSRAENRSFFLTLFRHLNYVGRRGCHRTALEFCKLLLSLDPDHDPLCVLLMIDYYAIRSGQYQSLIELYHAWEPHRNLSQLPNFAFSVPLAMFHRAREGDEEGEGEGEGEKEASRKLEDALITFPSLLSPLLDKCGVTVDPMVTKHSFFSCLLEREPVGLRLLANLYIERSFSVWKEPEVLTWLERCCRAAIGRVEGKDPLVFLAANKSSVRYTGVPRNIYRHVVISDLDRVVSSLPPELTRTSINMYDPLPPPDSFCAYTRPERTARELPEDYENPLLLLFRSMLPHYNPIIQVRRPVRRPFVQVLYEQIEEMRERYGMNNPHNPAVRPRQAQEEGVRGRREEEEQEPEPEGDPGRQRQGGREAGETGGGGGRRRGGRGRGGGEAERRGEARGEAERRGGGRGRGGRGEAGRREDGGGVEDPHMLWPGGAVGGLVGEPARPLNLQPVLAQLVDRLRDLVQGPIGNESDFTDTSGEESD